MKLSRTADFIQVTETKRYEIVYAVLLGAAGLTALAIGLFVAHEPSFILVGLLFALSGLYLGWAAETITTKFHNDGTLTIEYTRAIGHKSWLRKLQRSNILKIDHVKGNNMGSGWWRSAIYLDVDFKEQIEIGSRLEKDRVWTIDPEVAEIADFLEKPVNVISFVGVKNSLNKDLYTPHDKMRSTFRRPSQDDLDHESEGITPATAPS